MPSKFTRRNFLHTAGIAGGGPLLSQRLLADPSSGETAKPEGYFLDCWPSNDRLDRWAQRQVEVTHCRAILDHGVQFAFDCWQHYEYTANLDKGRFRLPANQAEMLPLKHS